MNDWTDGYVSDHAYDEYYFPQLAPVCLEAHLLLSGLALPPRQANEPLRYLELGYGQGLSLNIHAAGDQEAEFWGTDFLPGQTLHAQELAIRAGLGHRLLNDSFAQLEEKAKAGRLPAFDMIVLHGIWSWVNAENQQHILNIIASSLKPGGIVYVSYNSLPGRAGLLPVRELFSIYADRKGAGKDSVTCAQEALDSFILPLIEADAAFFSGIPHHREEARNMKNLSPVYLAHEYLNKHWHATYFIEMAKKMAAAGCRYATSLDAGHSLLLAQPEKTRAFMAGVSDPLSREILKDFNLNTGFRKDLFIRGEAGLPADEHKARLDGTHWILLHLREQVDAITVSVSQLTITLEDKIYHVILDLLAENNYTPKSLEYLRTHPRLAHLAYDEVVSCISMLFAGRYIFPVRPSPSAKTVSACRRFNRVMCEMTAGGNWQQHLVSPVSGCGFILGEYYQVFLLSRANGKTSPREWAEDAWHVMTTQWKTGVGESEKHDRKGREILLEKALSFNRTLLPYLEAMGITPASIHETPSVT